MANYGCGSTSYHGRRNTYHKAGPGAPSLDQLADRRDTYVVKPDDPLVDKQTDNWRTDNANQEIPYEWTGRTVFYESQLFPSEMNVDDMTTTEAVPAKGLAQPAEPTPTERATHNLTHLPYRSWCPLCVKAKAKQDAHRKLTDRQPVVQLDYAFLRTVEHVDEKVTVLTAIDIQTSLCMAVIVPRKGDDDYAVTEVKRFLLETGRTRCTLQTDQEPAMKTLIQRIAREMGGLAVRHAPTYSSQAQGSIERLHATLVWSGTGPTTARGAPVRDFSTGAPPSYVVDGTTRRVATKSLLAAR